MNTLPPLPDSPRNSGFAIWSLVLGILSVVCFYIFTAIPAVICGHVALSRIKRSGGALGGNGLAIAGLVTGYLAIAMSILIIPLLAAIAIPNFVKARDTARQNACINNLRQIDGAKHGWALDNRKQPGEAVDEGAINHYLKRGVSPVCPAGGVYTYGFVGEVPTCSVPGHEIPAR
jgi:competence protein ComGC